MAGIKQPILDIITKLREITVANGEGGTMTPNVRIWNNQIKYESDGKLYDFPKPAFFVEVVNAVQFQTLAEGMQSADLGIRVHIVHEYYDAQDGTFEQDLVVFELRDQVRVKLMRYEPTACGPLVVINEEQDYEHTNIYHYVVDFVCHFIDSKGSPYDPARTDLIDKDPPTDLELTVNAVDSIPGKENTFYNQPFKINQ